MNSVNANIIIANVNDIKIHERFRYGCHSTEQAGTSRRNAIPNEHTHTRLNQIECIIMMIMNLWWCSCSRGVHSSNSSMTQRNCRQTVSSDFFSLFLEHYFIIIIGWFLSSDEQRTTPEPNIWTFRHHWHRQRHPFPISNSILVRCRCRTVTSLQYQK